MYEYEYLTIEVNEVEQEAACDPLSGMCPPDTRCYPGDEY